MEEKQKRQNEGEKSLGWIPRLGLARSFLLSLSLSSFFLPLATELVGVGVGAARRLPASFLRFPTSGRWRALAAASRPHAYWLHLFCPLCPGRWRALAAARRLAASFRRSAVRGCWEPARGRKLIGCSGKLQVVRPAGVVGSCGFGGWRCELSSGLCQGCAEITPRFLL